MHANKLDNAFTARFLGDSLVENHALERALEPLHRVSLGKLVLLANLLLLLAAAGNAVTRALQHDVEIHTVDTRGRIVLDTEINVFGDTEAEVTRGTKVLLEKLKLLPLEAALLWTSKTKTLRSVSLLNHSFVVETLSIGIRRGERV